jgi:uncharacterized protein (DUF58 family)
VSAPPVPQLLRAALTRRSRARVPGAGAAAVQRGDGYEFAELRAYVPGDDLRRIDWAATARAGTPQSRVVFEERGMLFAACIIASASMQLGRVRSNYAMACEAAHVWFAAAGGDDRCARIEGSSVRLSAALRGRNAAAFCSHACADAATLRSGLAIATQGLPRGSSLLLISDFFELDEELNEELDEDLDETGEAEDLLRACARRHDLTALVARDPWHAGLPLRGFVRLRDARTARSARLFIDAAARERYRQAVAAREAALCARLTRYGARSGLLDQNVSHALLQALGVA